MGGQKRVSDGTDPRGGGSDGRQKEKAQGTCHPPNNAAIGKDAIDEMEQLHKPDPATADRWFDRQLNQLYSEVISEPLPKEFLELIDKLRAKTPTK